MPRIPRREQAAAEPTDVTTAMAPVDPGVATDEAPAPAPVEPLEQQPDVGAVVVEQAPADATPRFRERTRMRRRLRYLRGLRELAFRDLGGLMFDLHRFGRERGDLVTQKLESLAGIDRELRALETALQDRRDLHELREPGIAACSRCQTLHDPEANFCPGCGTSLRGATIRDASEVSVTPAGQAPAPTPSTTPS